MDERNITSAQAEVIDLIRDGKVQMTRCGTAAFRILGASPQVVGKLVSLGLARWPKGPVGEQTCELTPAAQAARRRKVSGFSAMRVDDVSRPA